MFGACPEPRPRMATPAPPPVIPPDVYVATVDPSPAVVTTKYSIVLSSTAVIGSFEFTRSGDTFATVRQLVRQRARRQDLDDAALRA
jgi:hypothetical protein